MENYSYGERDIKREESYEISDIQEFIRKKLNIPKNTEETLPNNNTLMCEIFSKIY